MLFQPARQRFSQCLELRPLDFPDIDAEGLTFCIKRGLKCVTENPYCDEVRMLTLSAR